MFTFERHCHGSAERWSIYVLEAAPAELRERLGASIGTGDRPTEVWEVGRLVLIHGPVETDFVLTVREELTDDERTLLVNEVELLVGRGVHSVGAEWQHEFVLTDALRCHSTNAQE